MSKAANGNDSTVMGNLGSHTHSGFHTVDFESLLKLLTIISYTIVNYNLK